MSNWISDYERAIREAGIPTYMEATGFAGWDGDGYYPFRKLTDWLEHNRGKGEDDCPLDRRAFVKKYGFAIPNQRALELLAPLAAEGLVEVGAGCAYWLYEMSRYKPRCRWTATDAQPPVEGNADNPYQFEKVWEPAEQLRAVEAVQKYSGLPALLMIWPSYDEPWPHEALAAFKGATFAYVGKGAGGCNGDDCFWERIERDWDEEQSERIPYWWGVHDRLTIYRRKP